MSKLDYSKWNNIEISDDEDDTHPNIDTPSLYRWRHQARVDREAEADKEKKKLNNELNIHQRRKLEMKQKIKEMEEQNSALDSLNKLKLDLAEIEKQEKQFAEKEEELKKKEKLTAWNVDSLCKEGKSKTVINKAAFKKKEVSEDEMMENQKKFTGKYEKEIKKFGMTQKYEDSQNYLNENQYLVCEETCNYLVLWCIELQVEEKTDLMNHVSHQTIVLQFILELAKTLDYDPRACVPAFFSRIKLAQKEYMDSFNDELLAFRERIKKKAQERIDRAVKEYEEEERLARLGPGGLDPVEVFESLPPELQKCFESKDTAMLETVLTKLPPADAEYHLKRCIDSGMWVANAKEAGIESETTNENETENEYATIEKKPSD